jgi:hypothetical protein
MSGYKFSQVVFAICRTSAGELAERSVHFRLKRLLALDRSELRRKLRFAFFDKKPQGKGVDILFSAYEAFALFLANSMLEARFPQLTVLRLLRQARSQLSEAYERCLELPERFEATTEDDPWISGYPMLVVVGARNPSFGLRDVSPFAVCMTDIKRREFTKEYDKPGVGFSFFPLARPANLLTKYLTEAPVQRRGRK